MKYFALLAFYIITGTVNAIDILPNGGLSVAYDQVVSPQANANVDIDRLTTDTDVSLGSAGGITVNSKLVNLGVGNAAKSETRSGIDVKNLSGNLNTFNKLDVGGGLNIKNVEDIEGGFGTEGGLNADLDLKNLKSSINYGRDTGIGGIITGEDSKLSGGAGSSVKLSSGTDIREGTSDFDLSSKAGGDGRINLPGKLGGLVYHIDDVTDITSSIDFSELSQRSLQILKETRIVVNIDLPGDKLEDISMNISPSININKPIIDLDKLGSLKLLAFSKKFAKDMLSINEFNMLTEANILDSLSSGLEFAARLDILRALANEIGTISGMTNVVEKVRLVLADMICILEALRRVKLLPKNVRNLGIALNNFDVTELKIELPRLELLNVVEDKPGMEVFKIEGEPKISMESGEVLSNFRMDEFLSLAQFGEKVSNNGLDAIADISNPTLIEKARAVVTPGNILGVASIIPSVATKVTSLNGLNGNTPINAVNQAVSGANKLFDVTPANITSSLLGPNFVDQLLNSDVGKSVKESIEGNKVKDVLTGTLYSPSGAVNSPTRQNDALNVKEYLDGLLIDDIKIDNVVKKLPIVGNAASSPITDGAGLPSNTQIISAVEGINKLTSIVGDTGK